MKSKLAILLLLFIFLNKPKTGNAQAFKEIENKQLASVLTFVEETKMLTTDNFSLKAYRVGIPTDTIPNSKSEEIYNRIFLCISETGEFPQFKVYELSKLYNVGQLNFYSVDPYNERFEFVSGMFNERKVNVFEINIKTMTIMKVQ